MMRSIERTTKFKRDYRREKKIDPSLDEAFLAVIVLLADDDELPERLRDHSLGGEWKGYRDCHIRPDLVLIYSKEEGKLMLARLGSHSELFG